MASFILHAFPAPPRLDLDYYVRSLAATSRVGASVQRGRKTGEKDLDRFPAMQLRKEEIRGRFVAGRVGAASGQESQDTSRSFSCSRKEQKAAHLTCARGRACLRVGSVVVDLYEMLTYVIVLNEY